MNRQERKLHGKSIIRQRSLSSKKIHCLLWNPEVHYCVYKADHTLIQPHSHIPLI
jgi:hypothetical protein